MPYYIGTSQPSTNVPLPNLGDFLPYLSNPSALTLLGVMGAYAMLSALDNKSSSGKLATSYWGSASHRAAAAKLARKQIAKPQRNAASLFIGMPDEVLLKLQEDWINRNFARDHYKMRSSVRNPLFVPEVQRGVAVAGAAGTGKSFSVIDPLIRSAIDQGFPLLLYDFKFPSQTSRHVAYAFTRGYNVRFFTPNFLFSDCCNILEFLRDSEDAVAAGQLAEVISKNINLNAGASGDKFFEDAGATLVQGIFLLAKAVGEKCGKKYADLMTAAAILSLPNLGKRLKYARELGGFSVWTMRPVAQVISVSNSAETEASIIGTAQRTFEKFMKKSFIGAFSGDSTIPLDLDGKTMLVCGLDRNNRDIVGPLMAAVIHMIVSRNISRPEPRKDPLCVFLDELPTMYLPQLYEWLTQNREDGFCGILGFQNLGQLEKIYGKEVARIIFGNCATKFLFNPQEVESAEYFNKILGEFDILYKTKSRSHSSGKSSGSSRSSSENRQKRSLLEPAQWLKLGTGDAILLNPAYSGNSEQYVPIRQKIKISQSEIKEQKWSQEQWPKLWDFFCSRSGAEVPDEYRRQQFEERYKLVEELFPEPPEENSEKEEQENSSFVP